MTKIAIYFDMDGTIADLYGVQGWQHSLDAHDPTPYIIAKPMQNFSALARRLNRLKAQGVTIGIISWLAKNTTAQYDAKVTAAKLEWLRKHLPSVQFDEIHIVPYGTPKASVAALQGCLFDDNTEVRAAWIAAGKGFALPETNILETLKIF
jgi:phosphoglycolate phosphatase-like HAD superfamily hydrolase